MTLSVGVAWLDGQMLTNALICVAECNAQNLSMRAFGCSFSVDNTRFVL